jgi:purine-nucleoside phosphorylase
MNTERDSKTDPGGLLATIRARAGAAPVRIGLILGSGLGPLAGEVEGVAIDYADLPGFPAAGVSGHRGQLIVGDLHGVRVAVLSGRAHFYETGRADAMRRPLEVLAGLGAGVVIVTNAAGSLRADCPPGSIMMIGDHIAMFGPNPLLAETFETRFVPMTEAYDPDLRAALRLAAEAEGVALPEGVYAWLSGPSFETPAEIRALRVLGADVVGMSTAPEVILARFLGLRVAAVSVITNMGAGMSDESISHDNTKAMAPLGAALLQRVLWRFLRNLP